jgi:hypothetical protein
MHSSYFIIHHNFCIGNSNTVGGGLVPPLADLGTLAGLEAGGKEPLAMIDGTYKCGCIFLGICRYDTNADIYETSIFVYYPQFLLPQPLTLRWSI